MAQTKKRDVARDMRRNGKSIGEITKALQAKKSTVSYWCRDISLSRAQTQKLVERQKSAGALGRLRAAELKRAQRMERTRIQMLTGARDIGALSSRDIFILGLALYWGEGYKKGNDECGITNSDPDIIRLFIEWVQRAYKITKDNLTLRVSINASHAHRVAAVEKYWSTLLGIPLSQFTTTSIIKSRVKKTYANHEIHVGTLRVKVRRGTALRRRILGSIEEVRTQIAK